jgi:predicted GIY-YIG superfamily endonuclease
MSIPYVQGLSEKIRRLARPFGLHLVFRRGRRYRDMLLRTKPPMPEYDTKNVVYQIPCNCGKVYVGETGRPWQTRIKEHKANIRLGKLEGNLLAQHAWDTGHTILFQNSKILLKERHAKRRRIKEALIMKAIGEKCISRPSTEVSTLVEFSSTN